MGELRNAKAATSHDQIRTTNPHLVDGAAGPSGGVRPVDLVRLAHLHVDAVLPLVLRGELGVVRVVVVAAEAAAHLLGPVVVGQATRRVGADGLVDGLGGAGALVLRSVGVGLGGVCLLWGA